MKQDPIVAEVRKEASLIFQKLNNDKNAYAKHIYQVEKEWYQHPEMTKRKKLKRGIHGI